MVENHVWLIGEMVIRADTLTDEQLDAPIEIWGESVNDNLPLRSLLSRLVGQMNNWNAAIDSAPYDFEVERGETVASMPTRLVKEGSRLLSQVREVIEQGRIDETFVDVETQGVVVAFSVETIWMGVG